jgi:murein DD-endopeptidase MepM/ murein hydrolase activator NlpD
MFAGRRARNIGLASLCLVLVGLSPSPATTGAGPTRFVLDELVRTAHRRPVVSMGVKERQRFHDLSLARDGYEVTWYHPLAGRRLLPTTASRKYGAPRDGGRPECGRGHCGVDLGQRAGLVVHAAADGEISRIVHDPAHKGGRYVRIRHMAGYCSYYMHLDTIHPDIYVGLVVQAGDPLGTTGRSGIVRSAPHLHFAVSRDDEGAERFVDPTPMLREARLLARPAGW